MERGYASGAIVRLTVDAGSWAMAGLWNRTERGGRWLARFVTFILRRLIDLVAAAGSGSGYGANMARKKRYLTATMADGTVKTIGPTATPFTHYWRIVAHLGGGRTEVFWGHVKSLGEATRKRTAATDAARQRGWERFAFEIVEVTEASTAPDGAT